MITATDGQTLAQLLDERAEEVRPDDGVYTPTFIDSAEFAAANYRRDWLVENILVAGEPAIVGGPKKSLKTSVIVDLALSLAFGVLTRFLGRFEVPRRGRVAVISGESGEATLQEIARRACASKHVTLRDAGIIWGFDLPRLAVREDVEMLVAALGDREVEVLILDPLYLCLLSGAPDLQAANLYHIGPLLRSICDACRKAGITPVLVHHTRKMGGAPKGYPPPELDDLAFAGVAEFARQWILLGRRAEYDPESGCHQLWLSVGGSAGQSGRWGLDVHEGRLRTDFGGRVWEPSVRSLEQIALQQRVAQADAADSRAIVVEERRRDRVLDALARRPSGETVNGIAQAAHLSNQHARIAVDQLTEMGRIEAATITKGSRCHAGWRLVAATNGGAATASGGAAAEDASDE